MIPADAATTCSSSSVPGSVGPLTSLNCGISAATGWPHYNLLQSRVPTLVAGWAYLTKRVRSSRPCASVTSNKYSVVPSACRIHEARSRGRTKFLCADSTRRVLGDVLYRWETQAARSVSTEEPCSALSVQAYRMARVTRSINSRDFDIAEGTQDMRFKQVWMAGRA